MNFRAKLVAAQADLFLSEINDSILSLNPVPKTKDKEKALLQAEEEMKEKGADKQIQKTKVIKEKSQISKIFSTSLLDGALRVYWYTLMMF
jgi:hypothetical protein